jgi:Mn-dependent DtxR family transcriptional regulator
VTWSLGYPTHDPHGDPIPNRNLEWPQGEKQVSE